MATCTVPAEARKILMDFKKGHTLKLDRELFKKATFEEPEDARQVALGNRNSFHTTAALIFVPLGSFGKVQWP